MYRCICTACALILLLLLVARPARAQGFTVSSTTGAVETPENAPFAGDTSKTRIRLRVSNAAVSTNILVRGNTVSSKIESLTVVIATPMLTTIRITGPTDGEAFVSADMIDFVVESGQPGDLIITNLRTSGNVGSIRSHGLNFASIGGSCVGGTNGNAIEIVDRDPNSDSILQNVTVGGSLLGNVVVEDGAIQDTGLTVTGTIGTPAHPVTVSAKASAFINSITCSAFYGTLRGPGTLAAPPTGLFRTTSGPVEGELRISSLFGGNSSNSGLRVAGDVNANVPITFNADAPIVIGGKLATGKTLTVLNANQGISMGGLDQTARLIVKGSLPAGKSITIGTTSKITMGGQVILNADNTTGTWGGTVIVGSTLLSPAPAYPISSALLGTGAVGLVPFQFYRQDCSPPQVNTTSSPMVRNSELAGGNYPAIRLRFYGPVALPAGQDAINTIRVFQGVPPTSLEDDETFNEVDQGPEMTGSWTASLAAVPFNAGRQELRLACTGGTPAAGPYYITNMGSTAQLLCDIGLATNPPVAGFTYRFTVTDIAAGCGSAFLDYNGDSVVNPDDVGDYITDYYTYPPVAGPGGYATPCAGADDAAPPFGVEAYRNYGYKADFYKDDNACSATPIPDDLGDYITAYFNFCV